MCRKVTYHRPCGHVTSRFQHRPCKNGNYCPRITQELNSDDRCGGCIEDAKRVTEHPIRPVRSDFNPQVTGAASSIAGEEEFQRQELEWSRRYEVNNIFDQGILTAQYMDQRTLEMKESRRRRAERVSKHEREGLKDAPASDSDSFQWVPKKWWRNLWKWRTRPSMFIDGENGHSKHCACCHDRRGDLDEFRLAYRPRV
ncbi:hypothetical protein TWF718_005857 [Orbilia javanica]|uniref:Uncharacterized protein n=1 Tax=Orbilia javanica TaxID=47235 RepID=A0AAN8MZL4_9PEZI